MNACDPNLLSLYLDGELSLPDRWLIEQHMRRCPSCTAELTTLERMDSKLQRSARLYRAMPRDTDMRIRKSLQRRRRLLPVLAFGRMMPAAMGSCIAALFVLMSANWGAFLPHTTPIGTSAPGAQVAHVIRQQSQSLQNARRVSAIMNGALPPQSTPPVHIKIFVN